ncbi:DUF4402 domain-containing protein [Parerythrobacter jejuensis]|uniref:DUF4402 domain-containing protein n=1 Tax=Parerythrobacter jejuensis TaxID=795812 RepID=A0A845ALS0_9SPHN|nr:DUF4402 domain-containing protein [Parerythrobacter jejuensis]MXP31210.1 DUF4402 domain-containing protein [Parerythrobacter jejuensis]MXP33970.1 DUF4402 domain-containing protein [Parerythrobacter jejuensis]
MMQSGSRTQTIASRIATTGAVAATALLCLAAPAAAQSNSAAPDASASVIASGTMRNTGDLDFGKVAPGDTGGTIVVAPDNSATVTGTVLSVSTPSAASFIIERRTGLDFPAYVSPTTADSITLIHATDTSETMQLTNFTNDFNRTRTIFFGLFTVPAWFGQTSYDFRVGGTLNVAGNQMPGVYTGEFVVRVDFE